MPPVFIRAKNVAAGRRGLVAIAASVTETPGLVKSVLSSQPTEYADESKAGIHSAHAENGETAAILRGNAGRGQNFAAEAYVRKGNAVTLIIQWIICHKRYHGSLERGYRDISLVYGTINISTP
ncbi:unnamed protein product [Clonostachys chloroleuca]|uniref:Uncharacterized protein n=1 Tax=Clonostachys chloroleuca TaxID=1926264 RepID=A0AA35MCW9_9HYPO|nr:unnamed protein product [Clonostachys chloroleuca]